MLGERPVILASKSPLAISKLAQLTAEGYSNGMVQDNANARQEGGSHYRGEDAVGRCPHCRGEIQHWDVAASLRGLEYAASKYLWRWRIKGGLESLKKVIHYTQKLIEIHFPDTVVIVSYEQSEKVQTSGGVQPREQSFVDGTDGGQSRMEAETSQRMAEGAAAHPEGLVGRCETEAGFGVRCKNFSAHKGDHRF